MSIPLKELRLEKRWPRLLELQTEITELTRQTEKAAGEVQQLEAQLGTARSRDLDAEAEAVRSGKQAPEPSEEPKVQKQLDAVRRNRDVLQRALEAAQMDLGALRQKHQVALYEDVAAARQRIANEMAEHAREVLKGFGRYSDLHYLLKDLRPAAPPPDENRPADRSTLIPAVQVVSSPGPDRGTIEQMLKHLISLAPKEEGEEDAA